MEDKARDARPADNPSIRALFEEIHARVLFGPLPPSMLERLVRAQRRSLEGNPPPITEAGVADAVNKLGRELDNSTFTPTNALQVRLLRIALYPEIKHLLKSPTPPPANSIVGNDMSPAGAVFLGFLLLRQRLTNPAWFGNVDEQNQRFLATRHSAPPKAPYTLEMKAEPPEAANFRVTVTNGFADHHSKTRAAFDEFLDVLKIDK